MPLTVTTVLVVIVGCLLPYSPLAGLLRFVALPAPYFVFLAFATVTYLLLVEVAKRWLFSSTKLSH